MVDPAASPNEKLCLKWNNFEDTISRAFQNLRTDGDFFDVTLACEDQFVEAHRSILSTCSTIFHNILKLKPHNQPIIFLRGVTHKILLALMDFMYQGEVSIDQDSLAAFLAVGEDLQIRGLTEGRHAEEEQLKQVAEQVETASSKHNASNLNEDFNWNTIEDFKGESKSQEVLIKVEGDTSVDQEKPLEGQEGLAPRGSGERNPRNWLTKFVAKEMDGKYHCTICSKVHPRKINLIDHIEYSHFQGMFIYTCDVCEQVKQTRRALQNHKNNSHNKTKMILPVPAITEEESPEQLQTYQERLETSNTLAAQPDQHGYEKGYDGYEEGGLHEAECIEGLDYIDALIAPRMQKVQDNMSRSVWRCLDCGKESKLKADISRNVESCHISHPGLNCHLCGKFSRTRESLRSHMKGCKSVDAVPGP